VPSERRPPFARDYPADDELDALVALFEAGNYRGVRRGAARIDASAKDEGVKRAARDLRSRTGPSRFQLYLLAVAALLVTLLSAYEIVEHDKDHPRPSKNALPPHS